MYTSNSPRNERNASQNDDETGLTKKDCNRWESDKDSTEQLFERPILTAGEKRSGFLLVYIYIFLSLIINHHDHHVKGAYSICCQCCKNSGAQRGPRSQWSHPGCERVQQSADLYCKSFAACHSADAPRMARLT